MINKIEQRVMIQDYNIHQNLIKQIKKLNNNLNINNLLIFISKKLFKRLEKKHNKNKKIIQFIKI